MPFEAPGNRLETFFDHIRLLSLESTKDAFMNEIMETGGSYDGTELEAGGPSLFEISLHEVLAYGRSEEDAIKNWLDAARARLQERAEPDVAEDVIAWRYAFPSSVSQRKRNKGLSHRPTRMPLAFCALEGEFWVAFNS